MEKKYTKGPWEVLPIESKYYGTRVKVGDAELTVWTPDHYCEPFASIREIEAGWEPEDGHDHVEDSQSYANALLIAAAPELLEALEMCVSYGSMTGDQWVIDKAISAISKALKGK